jgi:predicted XRE-type DNA-binding protein
MTDQKLRPLFFGILNGSCNVKDHETIEEGRVLITCEWVAYQVDEHEAFISGNHKRFTAIKYLEQLKEALPMGWKVEWSEPSYSKKLARTALLTLPDHVYELLDEDLRLQEKPRVYLRSGKRRTKNLQTSSYADIKQIQEEQNLEVKNDIQEKILNYLHRRSSREFDQPRLEEALEVTKSLGSVAANATRRKLANIVDYPKPIYHTVEGCYRFYSGSLQYLPSKVRYALYPEMKDVDLKSCHLSIITSVLGLERSRQLLQSGESLWGYLIGQVNIDSYEERSIELKSILKKAIYSISFGASKKRVKTDFREGLQSSLSAKEVNRCWKNFREIDVVDELFKGTTSWRTRIKTDGYYIDPFGVRYDVTDSQSVRRACFNYCSALELKLIYAVYKIAISEEAKDKPRFKILLHSHDGVTIKFLRREHYKCAETFSMLKNAVDVEARHLGISTTLELKD